MRWSTLDCSTIEEEEGEGEEEEEEEVKHLQLICILYTLAIL
jgi:hypothetical protein